MKFVKSGKPEWRPRLGVNNPTNSYVGLIFFTAFLQFDFNRIQYLPDDGKMTRLSTLAVSLLCLSPLSALATSTGPPIQRTGAPVDGGVTCTACHRTFAVNSDPRGSVSIAAKPYVPGVMQTIQVTITHPEALRWGFQLTSRSTTDASKQVGSFAPNTVIRVRCQGGVDGPCVNGVQEFASHRSATITTAIGSYTYSVDWTPPATNVGDIVLYAAGNAANNGAGNGGDYIFNTSATISPAACDFAVLPQLKAAVSAASYQGTISSNSLISLFGSGFQPTGITRGLYPADLAAGKVPTLLSCFAVEVNRKRAPLTYTRDGQVNAIVPSGTAAGNAEVRVVVNPNGRVPIYSAPITVTAADFAPGLFTVDGKKAVAQISGTSTLVTAAKAGDLVTLYATGLGDLTTKADAADIATGQNAAAGTVTVSLNGTPLAASDVLYVGSAPGTTAALYQINIRIPAGAKSGDAAVRLSIGTASSPDGITIPIL